MTPMQRNLQINSWDQAIVQHPEWILTIPLKIVHNFLSISTLQGLKKIPIVCPSYPWKYPYAAL